MLECLLFKDEESNEDEERNLHKILDKLPIKQTTVFLHLSFTSYVILIYIRICALRG